MYIKSFKEAEKYYRCFFAVLLIFFLRKKKKINNDYHTETMIMKLFVLGIIW